MMQAQSKPARLRKYTRPAIKKDFRINKLIYLMGLPVLLYYLVFAYVPMYGLVIAFEKYAPAKGILGSDWVGLKYFQDFFSSYYCFRLFRNTFLLGVYDIIWSFPMPIIFALMLNEMKFLRFKKTVQTITYMPYFISMVIIANLILEFTSATGMAGAIMQFIGVKPRSLMGDPAWFRSIYVVTNIWQYMGFNSIIFLAALAGIDQELYEAATIDGAGRWQRIWHVTLPGISATITILLILRLGSTLNVGFEKIFLIYNAGIYETADVISTFVYRKGLKENQFSYAAAIGLFNSVINFVILVVANTISRKVSETSLW